MFPLPARPTPQEVVYQLNVVPLPPVYDKVVPTPEQTVKLVAVTEVGVTGNGFTVMVTVWQVEFPQGCISGGDIETTADFKFNW